MSFIKIHSVCEEYRFVNINTKLYLYTKIIIYIDRINTTYFYLQNKYLNLYKYGFNLDACIYIVTFNTVMCNTIMHVYSTLKLVPFFYISTFLTLYRIHREHCIQVNKISYINDKYNKILSTYTHNDQSNVYKLISRENNFYILLK